jgi:hypothetical protein
MGSNGGELIGWDPYFTAFYVFDAAGFSGGRIVQINC